MKLVRAKAHTNIALIKYWGKAQEEQNLPAVGSLSLTLDNFWTETSLEVADSDIFVLNNQEQTGERLSRVSSFLDCVRELSNQKTFIKITSTNHVPTQSGLASSASGFAALATAANQFFNLNLNDRELSKLARIGSGSAARSILGGLVYMHKEGFAEAIESPKSDLNLIVIQCSNKEKSLDSRKAMLHTSQNSPFYSAWVASHQQDLDSAKQAILAHDFTKLGELTEHSTLKMHASLMASQPGHYYFEPLSIQIMNQVKELRDNGLECYFTLDAGPHVKVLCEAKNSKNIFDKLKNIFGITNIQIAKAGPAAKIL